MYRPDDTIVAVSTPASEKRVIVRISGPDTVKGIRQIFDRPVGSGQSGVTSGQIVVAGNVKLDATLYLFKSPHSYTGEDLAEIHVFSNRAVTDSVATGQIRRRTNTTGSQMEPTASDNVTVGRLGWSWTGATGPRIDAVIVAPIP